KQFLTAHRTTEHRRSDAQPGQPDPRRNRTRRPRRTVLVAGAVLTAAAVAIATATAVGTHPHPHVPKAVQPAPPATAAQLLAKIATAPARPPSTAGPDS